MFGAHHALHSDNGTEFTAVVVKELMELLTELVIVHGKPRHPQSQGSVDQATQTLKTC